MLDDIKTVIWKEWKEIAAQGQADGLGRGAVIVTGILLLAVMGFVAALTGEAFGTTPMPFGISLIPVLMVLGLVCDSFAGERERHTLETLLASRIPDEALLIGKIAATVLHGWGLGMVLLVASTIGANLNPQNTRLVMPGPAMLVSAIVITFEICVLFAAGGVLVSLRAESVRAAQSKLIVLFFGLLLPPIVLGRLVPRELVRQAMPMLQTELGRLYVVLVWVVILAAVDVALILAAAARFRRSRLIAG